MKISNFFSVIKRHWVIILILLVVFVLRIPSLLEPHRYADEEIYLTLGRGLRNGLVFYRDIHDNKPPFLYLLAAIAGNLFWFRFSLLVFHAIGVIYFWKLASLVFDKEKTAALISTIFFALLSTLPFLEGNIANGENFMIVPAIIGVYYLYRTFTKPDLYDRLKIYPIVGFLFAIGFLFKIPILFDFLGICFFLIFLKSPSFDYRVIFRRLFSKKVWLMLIGFITPILLSIVYYFLKGAFEPYVRSALLQNVGYLSTWNGAGNQGLLSNPLIWRGIIVAGISIFLFIFSLKISFRTRFLIIWSVFSLYGALLSSRPYPHYLLEPLVPFSLLLMLFIFDRGRLNRMLAVFMFLLVVVSYINIDFWYYKTIPYYRNFVEYTLGSKSREEYLDFWGVRKNYEIAKYIKLRSKFNDQIYVWGTEPSIYTLTDLLPVGRYTVAYHVVDFNAFDETLVALQETPPKFIVVFPESPEFEELSSFISGRYIFDIEIDGVKVHRRAI